MVIMHRSGGIAKRLDLDSERKIRDIVKTASGSEIVFERSGGSFTFEMDVKSEGWIEPKKPLRVSRQKMQVDEVAIKSYFDALWEEPSYGELDDVQAALGFHRQ